MKKYIFALPLVGLFITIPFTSFAQYGGGSTLLIGTNNSTQGGTLFGPYAPIVARVLGVSVDKPDQCTLYLSEYLRKDKKQSTEQVKKLQSFLKKYVSPELEITGIFDEPTENSVRTYQSANMTTILKPWKIETPTGYVYKTTRYAINKQMCPSLNIAPPKF